MIREIAAAVAFISKFLRTKGLTSERQLQTFSQSLQELLAGERPLGAGAGGAGHPHPAAGPLVTEDGGRSRPRGDRRMRRRRGAPLEPRALELEGGGLQGPLPLSDPSVHPTSLLLSFIKAGSPHVVVWTEIKGVEVRIKGPSCQRVPRRVYTKEVLHHLLIARPPKPLLSPAWRASLPGVQLASDGPVCGPPQMLSVRISVFVGVFAFPTSGFIPWGAPPCRAINPIVCVTRGGVGKVNTAGVG